MTKPPRVSPVVQSTGPGSLLQPVVPGSAQVITPAPITPVQSQSVAPVPPTSLSPNAPTGPVIAMATCCPDVASFEGSAGARSSYFGYDDKTNLVANVGADEYWIPPGDPKTLPASKEERDGARWVSVGVGKETQLEINFDGSFTLSCLANCTYEVDPATVAEVSSPQPTATGAVFKIKGKAAGEATLKVICDGQLRGYFYIWCAVPVVIPVDVASIVTPVSRSVAYVVADLEAYINEVFRQSLISVKLKDAGAINVTPTATTYMNGAGAADITHFTELDLLAQAGATMTSNYRLYYYVAKTAHSGGLGIVSGGLGASGPGWAFFDYDLQASYNTMAHEFGHLINLSHPLHDFDKDEFPAFQLSNLSGNVLNDDPWNLMGYQGPVASRGPNRKPLRYRQWKKCNRS
ncbi:hypothetical protein IV417_02650 [Alphaproteobacteria bacterium KMM 3653]|uniref:Uncharacterized protein n=1 Tax=Harenicola maris TaxID=2841044 RepID=A0AAP2CKU5_9RHOB|nr:hypothetical protein [Harenicola maris]